MKALLKKSSALLASVILTGFSVGTAFGEAKVASEKPAFDDLLSPEYSGGGKQKPFKPKSWLELETRLKVTMRPEPVSKTCDKVTVKWYVAVKNADKPGTFLLFTKDVDYINIPLDEDIWFSVYLSPSSIKRLTGFDRAAKSAVEGVGYEVHIGGEKVAEETTNWKVGWWNTASEKISRSDVVPLLTKPQTPFAAMWWDRYAEVYEPASAR